MAYHDLGEGALDYVPCRYGKSKLLFRGPKRRLDTSYVAVLGGTETYGKFVASPYPALTEELIGGPVVNFGQVNAGIDVFANDETVMQAASGAAVSVVQVMGAQNLSNRFYAVHPRRNDRFLRASALLKTIYREVDFTEFNFTRHLLAALKAKDPDMFALVETELKEAWVARMRSLVSKIRSRVVLLWLADHAPDDCTSCPGDGAEPLFVDRDMIEAVRPYVAAVVEVVVSADEIADGSAGLVYGEMEEPAAQGLLGVTAHDKAARALHPVLARLL
ncbi:DUF6473 family protein [Sinisalibacter aestuarii]|uniref:DUF6473 domain-containing protein n=1 Tax=Sinisalibacter aestuarii TaxID=2949426 RepID=A0ABQ5LW97_9RHOB|nr:DUF6473 family protein [Sinisalibacter aestuarii]GKY89264.1 hypothetical protein STA1M1_31330 [Sinisalibacter aestuarii]